MDVMLAVDETRQSTVANAILSDMLMLTQRNGSGITISKLINYALRLMARNAVH